MRRRRSTGPLSAILLAVLLAGCAGPPALRLTDSDRAEIGRIEAYLNAIPRFEAHFTQYGAFGPGAGLVWLDRPGHLRVDYAGAASRLLVVADGRVLVLDRSNGSITTMPLSRSPLAILLTPSIHLSGAVTVVSLQHTQGTVQITLKKTDQPGQGSLTLSLADQPLRLQSVSITDPYTRVLTMALSDIDTRPVVTAGLFRLPPSGS